MQVCRNGHVITDLLHTYPERGLSHCDHCGAETLSRCTTCGRELPGADIVPGLVPIGRGQPPQYCSACGAAFPWTEQPVPSPLGPAVILETLLRRLPRSIRQLRTRHAERPPFRVCDEYDLEDLLRAVLPLHFEVVRPERRTPAYASGVRTDFLLGSDPPGSTTAVLVKYVKPPCHERQLGEQLQEDLAYYQRQRLCRLLVTLVYDPEGRLPDARQLEATWSRAHDHLEVRCVIAT